MNYQKLYMQIVDHFRKVSISEGENHHIIPRCLGGSNYKNNIVRLSYRAHFVCHMLLVKIHQNDSRSYQKMVYALHRLSTDRKRKLTSLQYEASRKKFVAVVNDRIKSGKHRFCDKEAHKRETQKRLANGTHNFLNCDEQRKRAKLRVENKTHNFLGESFMKESWANPVHRKNRLESVRRDETVDKKRFAMRKFHALKRLREGRKPKLGDEEFYTSS